MKKDETITVDIDCVWIRFQQGDEAAFRELYDRYLDKLFLWGMRYSHDREILKDCIQELFLDLYMYRRKLGAVHDMDAYLYVSLRRKCLKRLKKESRAPIVVADLPDRLLEDDIERETILRETDQQLLAKLEREVGELPSRQQEVLRLRYNQQLSYDAVSKIMDIPVNTCRTLLSRALRQLRQRMKGVKLDSIARIIPFLFFYC